MSKKQFAIHHFKTMEIVGGKFTPVARPRRVRVLVIAEGYAMVRRPGAMPYVASAKDLELIDEEAKQ